MNQLKYDEFKAFYQYDKDYHENIEAMLQDIVDEMNLRKELFTEEEENACIVSRVLRMEGKAYMELHMDNIEGFKDAIDYVKSLMNHCLDMCLFEEEEALKGTDKSTSKPQKDMGETEIALALGKMMKDTEHNYNLSLEAYEKWLERKPEYYDEICLIYNKVESDEPVEPPTPPEKKKKKKGKKKKAGRRR